MRFITAKNEELICHSSANFANDENCLVTGSWKNRIMGKTIIQKTISVTKCQQKYIRNFDHFGVIVMKRKSR